MNLERVGIRDSALGTRADHGQPIPNAQLEFDESFDEIPRFSGSGSPTTDLDRGAH